MAPSGKETLDNCVRETTSVSEEYCIRNANEFLDLGQRCFPDAIKLQEVGIRK